MPLWEKTKKITAAAAALLIALPIALSYFALPKARALDDPMVSARAALLMEETTGEVLFERNADAKMYPASTTKIMTALLALEFGSPEDIITVKTGVYSDMTADASTVALQEGEQLTLYDLLCCLLISSANEAANVVADYVTGGRESFVELMNKRAAQLGCTGTHFANCHGLSNDDHYTTARDLYLIAREALKNETFREIVNTATKVIPATNRSGERILNTTNYLLSAKRVGGYVYPLARGVKTGYTSSAGYCLVSTAAKNGLTVISVVLGCEKTEEGDIMSFKDTTTLLEWGLNKFKTISLVDMTVPVAEVAVELGREKDYVALVPSGSINALMPIDYDAEQLEKTITAEQSVTAPVTAGAVLGTMRVSYEGRDYGTVELVAMNDVSLSNILLYKKEALDFLKSATFHTVLIAIGIAVALYLVIMLTLRLLNRGGGKPKRPHSTRIGGSRKYRG